MKSYKKNVIGLFALIAVSSYKIDAAVLWEFREVESSVVGSFSGSLNLAGAIQSAVYGGQGGFLDAASPILQSSPNDVPAFYEWHDSYVTSILGGFGPGTGSTISVSTVQGDNFGVANFFGSSAGIFRSRILVPRFYESGDQLSGSIVFTDASFSTLGLQAGVHVVGLPSDTITIQFVQIPEPSTATLLFSILLASMVYRRRRNNLV